MTERSQEELLGMVGHELRSPLTAVLGYAQLLRAGSLTDEQRGYVDVIERNGRRLLRVIDEALVGAQLAAGEYGLTRTDVARRDIARGDVDLARLSRACGDELGPTAQAAGLSLTVEAPGSVLVSGDPGLLAQMITSLLSGAVRVAPRGGAVTVRVGLRARPDGVSREAVVAVTGTGGGVATGTDLGGLGLLVVRAVVCAHGGATAVDDSPDGGSRVTVILPTGSSPEAGSTPC